MKSIVIGNGQIGKAVTEVINQMDEVVVFDSKHGNEPPIMQGIDIIHICFPYKEAEFLDEVQAYIVKYKPMHVIIWSTVPIGTTKHIRGAVHSPVEGRHPKLAQSIKSMVRWIGANDVGEGTFFVDYFKKMYLNVKLVSSSGYTEALKLLSTTEYGVNIEFARYKKVVADDIGMPFELTKEWNRDYNKLYHNLDMDWAHKYVLDAPHGHKGGHCVTPNARLLNSQYPDDLVKIVGEL